MNGKMGKANMKKTVYAFLVALCAMSCTMREDFSQEIYKEKVSFIAHTESGSSTKTVLEGEVGDVERYISWEAYDSIGIATNNSFSLFENISEESSETALFEGYIGKSGKYYALYPYSSGAHMNYSDSLSFSLPDVQYYVENSFGRGSYPMVARKGADEDFHFQNLCGILVLRMTGDFTVKAITFSAKDSLGNPMKLSGKASVDMGYEETPVLRMGEESGHAIKLDCGEGVLLDTSEPVPFHIVLPPAVYSTFQITVATTDGRILTKEGTKPLKITRSVATKSGQFSPVDVEFVDLSVDGTANCYIVSDAGYYSIDGTIIGNGPAGLVENGGFHTQTVAIEPVSADFLWCDRPSVVTSVSYNLKERKVMFGVSGVEGNALIAAKDEDGTILWSWHIWVTDQPQEQTLSSAIIMDRNMGAVTSEYMENGSDVWGVLYQWGRKDPFSSEYCSQEMKEMNTIRESVQNPLLLSPGSSWWIDSENNDLWRNDMKTIYDPCPSGWRVSSEDVWRDLSGAESNENGVFISDTLGHSYWFPLTPRRDNWGGYESYNDGEIWTGHPGSTFHYYQDGSIVNSGRCASDSYPVRCMKDDSLDTSFPLLLIRGVSNIGKTSATVTAEVIREGYTDVVERGIIVGDQAIADTIGGKGEYKAIIEGLAPGSRYEVKAYAKNNEGTVYSSSVTFCTLPDEEVEDLSVYGTANSYIVSRSGWFKFKATIGRSQELLGGIDTVEVLWESFGNNIKPEKGDLVKNVTYEDGYITFMSSLEEGNAVICAKNSDGTILWSWHIWLTDQPAEQLYPNNAGVMMDRNLGATSDVPGDVKSLGLFYQWGRKDPFLGAESVNNSNFAKSTIEWPGYVYSDATTGTMEYAVQHPTQFIMSNNLNNEWLYTGTKDKNTTLWGEDKTIYDPCPLGWRVPDGGDLGVWKVAGFTNDEFDNTNRGYNFPLSDDGVYAWYPTAGYHTGNSITDLRNYGHYWSSVHQGGESAYYFYFTSWSVNVTWTYRNAGSRGHSVRCMKDEHYIRDLQPVVAISGTSDIGANSITVSAEVVDNGFDAVTERGVVYAITPGVTLESGTKLQSGSGEGVFNVTVGDLLPGTRYYIRAYAINGFGVSYSTEICVSTLGSGIYSDLSAEGTANSYMVSKPGNYNFHCAVRGNSSEGIGGVPVYADVLWQTKDSIISSVSLSANKVLFTVPEIFNQGNALIAVRDADSTVLWSWHIWVTDYEPAEVYHRYNSGAVMMDRNIGAVRVDRGVNEEWRESVGMMYQWGRKDPLVYGLFTVSSDTKESVEYYNAHPTEYGYGNQWCETFNYDQWSPDHKTVYDPCPVGYRVSNMDAVDGLVKGEGESYDFGMNLLYDDKNTAWYPSTPYLDQWGNYNDATSYGYVWLSNCPFESSNGAYNIHYNGGLLAIERGYALGYAYPVRCMREPGITVRTVSYTSTHNSAEVTGEVVSSGASEVLEYGVVWSANHNINLVITNPTDSYVVKGEEAGQFGEFSTVLKDLVPNSTIYARVYAISERGVEYGETVTIKTKHAGNNENYGDEDYDW